MFAKFLIVLVLAALAIGLAAHSSQGAGPERAERDRGDRTKVCSPAGEPPGPDDERKEKRRHGARERTCERRQGGKREPA